MFRIIHVWFCNGVEPPPRETLTYVDGGWGPNSELDSDSTTDTDLEAVEPSSSPDSQGQRRMTPGAVAAP